MVSQESVPEKTDIKDNHDKLNKRIDEVQARLSHVRKDLVKQICDLGDHILQMRESTQHQNTQFIEDLSQMRQKFKVYEKTNYRFGNELKVLR